MAEAKKQIRKNPYPLVVKGIFYVTADFNGKQYVVSNGLSFIRFPKEGEEKISKGDYVEIHGPVYIKKKETFIPIITGEAIVRKLSEEEVDEYKAKVSEAIQSNSKKADAKKVEKKPAAKKSKSEEQKLPWE